MAEDRKRRKGVPPSLTMEQAIWMADNIYQKAGSQPITHDDLAIIFDNVKTSSSFQLKLVALKTYGLLARVDDDTSALTELAVRLFSAGTEQGEALARLEVFRNPQPFAILHNAYAGQVLPTDGKYLANELRKGADISPDFYGEWVKRFEIEGRYAGIIFNDPRGRASVRRMPGPSPVPTPEKKTPDDSEERKPPPKQQGQQIDSPTLPKPKEKEFKIPTESGEIRLYVPQDCAVEDLEVARGLLELMIARLSKEK